MNIPMIRVLNVNWGLPLNSKTYKEVGMLMVQVLPYIYKVEYADDEGAIIHVFISKEQEEEIKELRNRFLYIDVWFEEEELEEIKKQRLLRWAEKKGVRKSD
jgi:spore germination protein GerM